MRLQLRLLLLLVNGTHALVQVLAMITICICC